MNTVHRTPLAEDIAACTLCAPHLLHGCRPVARFSATARILIIGQAPGRRVHESGIPWDDPSGARLREWTGISDKVFYDATHVALMPMGFCYPGKGEHADLPPRPECAPLWHDRILAVLPPDRLTLLVGSYATMSYLPKATNLSLTEHVQTQTQRRFGTFLLPHPSWRSAGWMKKNPWFETDVLPVLRTLVQAALAPRTQSRASDQG